MKLLDEACKKGARLEKACEVVGLSVRTLQRWRLNEAGEDMRMGPKQRPGNALTSIEEAEVLRVINSPQYRNLSVKQIVPLLADKEQYLCSESTMMRLLRREGQLKHRGPKKPRRHKKPSEKNAMGPNQIWSWDISYLRSLVAGQFFYLYMAVDIWSRKIVDYQVRESESSEAAKAWLCQTVKKTGANPKTLIIHQDNGSPMKGTLKASMENLGVHMSYSRPRVSNDNPYSESLFGTMKTRPEYPHKPFANIEQARKWCDQFVHWYNNIHLHSAIQFVTPSQRHEGKSQAILEKRKKVYEAAKKNKPSRWARDTRKWQYDEIVTLHPENNVSKVQIK